MIFGCADYRTYLKDLLVEKIRKNPNYSLRAFAGTIGVSPSMLSEVLKGEKKLSTDKAGLIANKLNLPVDEEDYFLSLVQLENARDIKQREKILARLKTIAPSSSIRDLSVDHFHSIADWLCVSGMALIAGHPEGLTSEEIATRLGVTKFEAANAMERWVRLDLMELGPNQRFRKTSPDHLVMKSKAPNGALRGFHEAMLEKAVHSLHSQTNDEKYVGSETIPFDPAKLKEVSEILEKAVSKILRIAMSSKSKPEVYHLGFQFFRLTKMKGTKK